HLPPSPPPLALDSTTCLEAVVKPHIYLQERTRSGVKSLTLSTNTFLLFVREASNASKTRSSDQKADFPFLKAGYSLNNEERHRFNRLLEDGTRRLRNHEDEIVELRQKLTMREEEKQALETTIAKFRFVLETWPRIPTEIWRNDFAMVCTANPKVRYADRSAKPTLVMPPVVLSHVCPRWRAIVLDSPELWTNIHLPQGADHLLRTVIKRSKGRPLDVHLLSDVSGLPDHAVSLLGTLWRVVHAGMH
ncbi:hypothetical protein L218DRAFT_301110, partial [Marasmius fiardii PR-910]